MQSIRWHRFDNFPTIHEIVGRRLGLWAEYLSCPWRNLQGEIQVYGCSDVHVRIGHWRREKQRRMLLSWSARRLSQKRNIRFVPLRRITDVWLAATFLSCRSGIVGQHRFWLESGQRKTWNFHAFWTCKFWISYRSVILSIYAVFLFRWPERHYQQPKDFNSIWKLFLLLKCQY